MTDWPSTKAKQVLKALRSIGWQEKPSHKKKGGSHRQLVRPGFPDFSWAFHDNIEIGPVMLKKIAKHTGLKPEDL